MTNTKIKTTEQLRQKLAKERKQRSKATKFEITMQVKVKDVGDVPADRKALQEAITKATENISFGDVIQVTGIQIVRTGAIS